MKISFEGQTIAKSKITGIGCYALNIIKNVLELDHNNTYNINVFDFLGRNNSTKTIKKVLGRKDIDISRCALLPYGMFTRFHSIFGKVPYNFYFNDRSDIFHFFNFILPEKVRGKTITTVHDMVYMLYPETMSNVNHDILRKNLARSCREADVIVTVSQNSRKEISELMNEPLEKIFVTYNAVDTCIYFPNKDRDLIRTKYGIDSPYILFLGTLEPRKNISVLIKAFHLLSQRLRGVKLVIAGSRGWKSENIFSLVNDLRLNDRVIFTGYVDDNDKSALYSCAEMFVFPSLYEGFGIPPLEAMACGTPVICSNSSSLPEVIGDSGILVEPKNIEHWAYEIERLTYDSGLRETLSRKGIVQAKRFRWSDSAKVIMDIYRDL
jgi:glycosyltransferase involved in cell wall biosynthesis